VPSQRLLPTAQKRKDPPQPQSSLQKPPSKRLAPTATGRLEKRPPSERATSRQPSPPQCKVQATPRRWAPAWLPAPPRNQGATRSQSTKLADLRAEASLDRGLLLMKRLMTSANGFRCNSTITWSKSLPWMKRLVFLKTVRPPLLVTSRNKLSSNNRSTANDPRKPKWNLRKMNRKRRMTQCTLWLCDSSRRQLFSEKSKRQPDKRKIAEVKNDLLAAGKALIQIKPFRSMRLQPRMALKASTKWASRLQSCGSGSKNRWKMNTCKVGTPPVSTQSPVLRT